MQSLLIGVRLGELYPLIPHPNWGSPRAGLRPYTHHLARRWPYSQN